MLNVVIFGAPGSGKGTQSEFIIREFRLDHISTGEILRDEIKSKTGLGKVAARFINRGELLPDDLIIDVLSNVLDKKGDSKGFIFDGFPRTIHQAAALKKALNARGSDVTIMLDLQVGEDELISRLIERGKRLGRSDDNPETIKSRLDVYHSQTAPLAEYYKKENKYHAVNGVGRLEDIFEQIKQILSPCQIS
ncbi:MAG: adenylate kinase [Tannerellaceae bacterium]|jgi:adenylate kinase|nr:adenylate kinase [Tannerellaceae bacterium]